MKEYFYKMLYKLHLALERGNSRYLMSRANCGNKVYIRERATIIRPENLTIEDNVTINTGVTIIANGGVTIREHTMLGTGITIISANHDHTKIGRDAWTTQINKPVMIEKNVWIGSGSIILPGVTVGEGAVVAAGSTVTKDVAPFTIVGGTTATEIKKRVIIPNGGE